MSVDLLLTAIRVGKGMFQFVYRACNVRPVV